MKHHAFSPRAAAAAAAVMAVLLTGGTATAAMAAVTSPAAPAARQGTPTAPGAPTGLTAAPGNDTATLSWSSPSSDGGSPVDRYLIDGGTSPSADTITDNAGGDTATIGGLTNGTTYYFRVHAQNAYGDGPSVTVTVTPQGPRSVASPGSVPAQPGPPRPTGLTAQARHGEVVLSWSPPKGGLVAGDGYLIYIGTSPGHEGAKPSVPYLIQYVTSYTVAPLKDGTRYYFQVALLDADNQVSARSAEVSAVPGAVAGADHGSPTGPSASVGATTRPGGSATAQPDTTPLRNTGPAQDRASSSLPAGLVILLAALVLAAAAGGATAVMLLRRWRHDRRLGSVPAPRRPSDDQPAGQSGRAEEMNGPRYR